jgi:hypothetical protein
LGEILGGLQFWAAGLRDWLFLLPQLAASEVAEQHKAPPLWILLMDCNPQVSDCVRNLMVPANVA